MAAEEKSRIIASDAGAAGSATPATGIGTASADLLSDPLLLGVPRVEHNGCLCPALRGIRLLRKLGQGDLSTVYLGIHSRLDVEVAVRVLSDRLVAQDTVRRFMREAQIPAAVRSPHLVGIMGYEEECGLVFFVEEYVAGRTAKQYLEAAVASGARGLSERAALLICAAATKGLRDVHAHRALHRNIRPQRIIIPFRRGTEELDLPAAKLLDPGLPPPDTGGSGCTAAPSPQTGMGTLGYMPPEQFRSRHAGPPADVYSMGATLYALLAGQPPFKKENDMQTIMATLQTPHDPLIKVRPDVSPALSAVVDKCLAKKPEERYADGQQLLNELEKCLRAVTGRGAAREPPRYAVFISYRREGGAETARLIHEKLEKRGLKAFLDVDDMRSGHFDERLLREIESAPHFIVILTPGCLDRCASETDWLRREIAHAIATQRNIVPIMKDGFRFPEKEDLPQDIADFPRHNGVEYSHRYFSAMMDDILEFLKIPPPLNPEP